jgi:hypothetical protein
MGVSYVCRLPPLSGRTPLAVTIIQPKLTARNQRVIHFVSHVIIMVGERVGRVMVHLKVTSCDDTVPIQIEICCFEKLAFVGIRG